MCCPAGKFAAVILHFGCDDGTTLRSEFGPPVEGATSTLGLVVEFVKGFDDEVLVVAGDVILDHSVDFGAHDEVEGFLVGFEGEVEAAVFVGFAGEGFGFFAGNVEGVWVGHFDFGGSRFLDDLEGEVVVDHGGFDGEVAGGVDAVGLDACLGVVLCVGGVSFERGIGGVLVDRDEVDGVVHALVEEDLVALFQDDDVPAVYGAGGTHEHGEDVGGGEDGGFVVFG